MWLDLKAERGELEARLTGAIHNEQESINR
jgi:hypothetical protein